MEEDVVWSRLGGGAAAAAAAEAAAAASGKGEAREIGTWKIQSVGDPAQQASFQLHGQSVETADVPSVRHLLLPPVSASQGKEARGRVAEGGDQGGARRAGLGRGARRPRRPRAQLLGLLTIALAWAERGAAASRGADRGDRVTESSVGERLDRKGPPAPSWPTRREGLNGLATLLVQPRLAASGCLGPAAGPAGDTAFRPLQGLACGQ